MPSYSYRGNNSYCQMLLPAREIDIKEFMLVIMT